MNPTLSLSLTNKGVDELLNRAYKLSLKKRSLLILLERPQTFDFLLNKGVFGRDELMEEVVALSGDGFVKLGEAMPVPGPVFSSEKTHAGSSFENIQAPPMNPGANEFINEEVILSEARFLMVNFCVDIFGTNSQQFVDALGKCKSVSQFAVCAKQIYKITQTEYPKQLKDLQAVIQEINQTAY